MAQRTITGGPGECRAMIDLPEVPLTVQEAADRLDIHIRRLRRILDKADYKARTLSGTRQTRSGMRPVTLLPPDLYADIEAFIQLTGSTEDITDKDKADNDKDRATMRRIGTPSHSMAVDYETIIKPYVEQIERLTADLERERARAELAISNEREAWKRAADAATREQTIRALPPATLQLPAPDGPQDVVQAYRPPTWWERLTGKKVTK